MKKRLYATCGKSVFRYLKPELLEKAEKEFLAEREGKYTIWCTAFCYQKMFGLREDPLEDPLLRRRIDDGVAMKPIVEHRP